MGEAAGFAVLPDAAGRRAADPHAARSAVSAFVSDAFGATAIEYGLLAALISVAILGSLAQVMTGLEAAYTAIGNAVTGS
ncbi:MAG: Flp family type IVb pilin [Rhizomicrobium sp.]